MGRVNGSKMFVAMVAILYFVLCWILYHWNTPGYLSSGIAQIYFEHGITEGYYSMFSFLVLYIAPLLCYVMLMMRKDQMHIVIRYPDREEIWKYKVFHMIIYIFQYTMLQFGVDIVFMLCCYPLSEIMGSRILHFLLMFFPNVFFYYVFFTSVFLMWQSLFSATLSFILTAGIAVQIYLVMVPSWNPFFFLSLLGMQIQNGVNEADVVLSYMNILSLDVIAVFMGLKRYHNKTYIS